MSNQNFGIHRSHSEPGLGDGGRTDTWRMYRPVIDKHKCIPYKKNNQACFICWLFCPDGVISRTVPPSIDYQYCKGCGICAEECPTGAISMVEETSFIKQE